MLAAVIDDVQRRARGQGLARLLNDLAHLLGHTDGRGFARTRDVDTYIGARVAHGEAGPFGETILDLGYLPQAHELARCTLPDDDVVELFRRWHAADQANALIFIVALELADRSRHVLVAQRVDDVGDRDVELTQLLAR